MNENWFIYLQKVEGKSLGVIYIEELYCRIAGYFGRL